MNKTAIKNFAIWARRKLIADISYRAGLMGITEDGIKEALPQSTGETEFYDIGTAKPYSISGEEVKQRKHLVEVIRQKEADTDYRTAYRYIIEEVAYTWFNRLIAIRFMEVNEYLPSRIRVLSSESGKVEPDLVTTPFDAELSFNAEEEQAVMQLKMDNRLDELFCKLFIKQCNALNEILPELFEKTNDYTELLLNLSVVDEDGVVYHLVHDIPESDFNIDEEGQVEIIGWLYQYYNTEPKAAVFARPSGQKIGKEDIPAATQLFTPDWIVRYMVENSLGRLWVEGHPNDELKSGWKYYLDEAKQEDDVQAQLDTLRDEYKSISAEAISLIDPCMGSGHILVYAFDVLMSIYESQGYTARDAAKHIVEKNIYGLELDKRAYQLAYFALMMKGRQYDRRFLTRDVKPNLAHFQDISGIQTAFLTDELKSLVLQLKDCDTLGSLVEIKAGDGEKLDSEIDELSNSLYISNEDIEHIMMLRKILLKKYDVVVTNPPYMGGSGMSAKLSDFLKKNYPDSKSDLFAVFIEKCRDMVKENGYQAMITQHSWMFLSSFENLRKKLLAMDTVNMAHLGARAFEEIGGEVVQTTSFVLRKSHFKDYKGTYCRLIEPTSQQGKEDMFLAKENRYVAQQDNFSKIPGSPVAYWVSNKFVSIFDMDTVENKALKVCKGGYTGNNDKYLRLWFEVGYIDIPQKWHKYSKGGFFRKWYGNSSYVILWESNGKALKCDPRAGMGASKYYGYEHLVWSGISSGLASFRYDAKDIFFDDVSPAVVFEKDFNWLLLGILNSKVVEKVLQIIAPTMHFQAGDIKVIPVCEDSIYQCEYMIKENIRLSKNDWDSFEISWDFKRHPLVPSNEMKSQFSHTRMEKLGSLKWNYEQWENECNDRFNKLKANEEELNRIFIDIYGLQDELTPEVDDKDVTVRKADLQRDIKSLISYAVGCMFGRYSLDVDGLAYAGGKWDSSKYSTFMPDKDNIIPITDEEYLEDDIVGLLCAWLKKVYGAETLEENLDFIASALDNKGSTSREIIRNYFLKDFFKDHCKIYQKRSIYWLFDSGKQNGFKALIYLHRYTQDTVGNLRVDYLHRMQHIYESEINRMQDMVDNSTNARESASAAKRKEKLQKQQKECREYDEKISHLALSRIELDLDDGVKVNYEKVQTASDGKKYQVLAKL
jgi:hypothetical protein